MSVNRDALAAQSIGAVVPPDQDPFTVIWVETPDHPQLGETNSCHLQTEAECFDKIVALDANVDVCYWEVTVCFVDGGRQVMAVSTEAVFSSDSLFSSEKD